jgi:hypothetical protein
LAEVSAGRNIDASGSGIIAQNIIAKATGEAKGLFVGFNSVKKKKGKGIMLAQKTARVTIVLPPKQQQPKAQIPAPRT